MPVFKGVQFNLPAPHLKVGDSVQDFKVLNRQFESVLLSDFKQKLKVISVVPSLDTGVCDAQTHRVNETLSSLPGVVVLTISNDLPFAQKRWCGAAGLDNIHVFSDYLYGDFAAKTGTLIPPFKLLNRTLLLLNHVNQVLYIEYVDNNSTHPNYDALMAAIKANS